MSRIRISVGAVAEASLTSVFRPFIDAAAKARAAVAGNMKGATQSVAQAGAAARSDLGKSADAAAKAAAKAYAQIKDMGDRATSQHEAQAQRRVRADLKAFDERLRASKRAREQEERDIAAAGRKAEREGERKRKASQRDREGTARDIVAGAAQNLAGFARASFSVAKDIARGAGVNFDLSSMVDSGVELEKRAVDLTNSAYMPQGDDADARVMRDPKEIIAEVQRIGDATANSYIKAMDGLQQFVGKTGDLRTGELVLERMAKLSRATASGLDDMISASGAVANALGDVSDKALKAEKIDEVMRSLAGGGKLGAVEIADLAKEFDKLGSSAGKFKFDGENELDSRVRSLKTMGALAQIARASGGAWNATIAANSVSGLVNTLSTPARLKAFKALEIDPYKGGFLKDPMQIIKAALVASNGDRMTFKSMFQNVMGERAVAGFMQTYLDNGGASGDPDRQKGALDKVQKQFDKIFNAEMSPGQVDEQFKRSMGTSEAKSQVFQNQLERLGGELAARALPALERLSPLVLKAVDAFTQAVGWAAENPGRAITLAIVGSIAKAAVGSAISGGIESLVKSAASGSGLGTAGALGLTLTIAAATIAIGTAMIDTASEDKGKGENTSLALDAEVSNAISAYNASVRERGVASPEAVQGLEVARGSLEKRITAAEDPTSVLGAVFTSKTMEDYGREHADAGKLGELRAELAAMAAELKNGKAGVQKVIIVGGLPGAGPTVDPSGRTGPGR